MPVAFRTLSLTTVAMVAFASNSLLCRMALRPHAIDAASFALVRVAAGALLLGALRPRAVTTGGSWRSALALAAYALLFSFAYLALDAGTGTLVLFGAVQVTMIGHGLVRGERPPLVTWAGFLAAIAGLLVLLLPSLSKPDLVGLLAMSAAGVAWGIYSIRGRGSDPATATTGNFARAVPFALLAMAAPGSGGWHAETSGLLLAAASGAVTSGLGYVVWYAALRGLSSATAAMVQLSVPVLAAIGGVAMLGESLTTRLAVAAVLVLGGVALALGGQRR